MNKETCICGDETQAETRTCVRCDKTVDGVLLNPMQRRSKCPVHHMIMFCGYGDFVCQTCKEEGWYSTAGTGGPSALVNNKTGERINYDRR
ncbi:Hypothetical protein HVR_LOCUS623 [uncultured virus]|nr:Hypothetical protein HVR_LOCUS623 [uncultured virus]